MALKAFSLAAALFVAVPAHAEGLRVFAAASLTDALDTALLACEAATGLSSTGIYAGSGTIARQIEQGAPADIFISANPQWMDWLEKRRMIVDDTRIDLLGNQLVMIEHKSGDANTSAPQPFAIADPTTVPVGRYTKQALESTAAWPPTSGPLIYANNVREVLAWVARGEAQRGIVYASDAQAEPRVEIAHEFSKSSHDPIRYPAAIITDNDTPNARRLLACLKGEEASNIFHEFGFVILKQ